MMTPRENGRVRYAFDELPPDEKEYHEEILLEEMDVQAWFAVAYSTILDQEVFIAVQ